MVFFLAPSELAVCTGLMKFSESAAIRAPAAPQPARGIDKNSGEAAREARLGRQLPRLGWTMPQPWWLFIKPQDVLNNMFQA